MAIGTVGLLIPLPHGQMNEQKDNAILFERTGLGEYLEQKDLTGEVLLEKMSAMIKEQNKYKQNSKKAKAYIDINAADKIVEQIYQYGRGKAGGS
jgi:UDP-N-acetylglucosamine--N-acetylmuramyl-(pentapeptide) pyrophosphoryl-undecaprenol N-acetylglucosamine transferase